MKLKGIVLLVVIIFLQISCKESTERSYVLDRSLFISDSLSIVLPDSIPHLGSLARPFFNATANYFSYISEEEGFVRIHTYEKDKASWKSISLDLNGPNRVYGNGAFNIIGDEIVYFPYNTPKVLRLSLEGVKTFDKSYFVDRNMAFDSKVKSPVIHDDGENLFFDLGSYVDFDNPSTFESTQTIGKFDYKNEKFYPLITYPKEFHDNTWSGNDAEHQFVVRDDLIYMNFVKSEFVYVYDKNGKFLRKEAIKSIHIKNSKGKKSDDSMENAIAQVRNGHYPKIIYDPWQDVFYRIGVFFDVNYDVSSMQDVANAFRKKKLVIITFDKDLNVLGHDEFDALSNRLNEYFHWVNEDGLYLYQARSERNENVYQFAKFSHTMLAQ